MNILVSSIGLRLRKERERLGLSQQAFGRLGGVTTNAQGKYENGDRFPRSDYFAAIATINVDLLFILVGTETPNSTDLLTQDEKDVLLSFRLLQPEDQEAVSCLVTTIAGFLPQRSTRDNSVRR
jgi:transcriptional regulator with XRE-family HTH domain